MGIRAVVSFFTFFLSSDESGQGYLLVLPFQLKPCSCVELWYMRVEEAITFVLCWF